jgi:circadian clock protein KaiB
MSQETQAPAAEVPHGEDEKWLLRLYVTGRTPKCVTALENLKRFCEERMAGRYEIEVVDLLENPRLAKDDQIIAIPTLVRKLPEPLRKVIGNLSDTERLLVGFDLKPKS